jgi:hypothetical protein
MAHRQAKFWAALGCVAALALGACSDDSKAGGSQVNNNVGPNNGADTNSGTSSDATNSDTNSDTNADGAGSDGSGPNNGACRPTTTFVEVYQPNVYLLIDRSQSMNGDPMTQAKAGLDAIADELAGRIRLGAGYYPSPSSGCGTNDMVAIGANTAADLKDAWSGLTAAGGTPTGSAIHDVGARGLLSEDGDSNDAKRQRALVVITDGDPTTFCEDDHPYIAEAEALAATGTPLFVVGFRSEANPDKLDALAEAGGTDAPGAHRFYTANSTSELTDAVRNISTNVIGCTHILESAPQSADLISVELAGQVVPQDDQNGFSYDASTAELSIHGSFCATLQDEAADGIVLAVTTNCPGCTLSGETCSADDACCSGTCLEGGTCGQLCQPLNGSCRVSSDCCGEATCAGGEGLTGTCVGG